MLKEINGCYYHRSKTGEEILLEELPLPRLAYILELYEEMAEQGVQHRETLYIQKNKQALDYLNYDKYKQEYIRKREQLRKKKGEIVYKWFPKFLNKQQ